MASRPAVGLVVFLSSSSAFAQQLDGALQVGLGTNLVSFSTLSFEGETPIVGGLTVETDGEIETSHIGLASDVQLHLGYGLSEQFLVGGILQVQSTNEETDATVGGQPFEGQEDTTSLLIAPKLEFSFLDSGSVRPYALAAVGYATVSQDDGNSTTEFSGPQILGGIGVHWFLAPGASLDPGLYVGYASLGGELDPDEGNTTDLDGSITSFGVSLGISGWVQ